MDYWACPSCHKVFKHFETRDGHITNVQVKDECQSDGYRLWSTNGYIPQCDMLHCPYCGYEADGYDFDLVRKVHNKGY